MFELFGYLVWSEGQVTCAGTYLKTVMVGAAGDTFASVFTLLCLVH